MSGGRRRGRGIDIGRRCLFDTIELDSGIIVAIRNSQSEKQLEEEPVYAARAQETERPTHYQLLRLQKTSSPLGKKQRVVLDRHYPEYCGALPEQRLLFARLQSAAGGSV
jgi:hypothetical protein